MGGAHRPRTSGTQAGLGIVLLCLLGSHGEVAHEHVGFGVTKGLSDINRGCGGLFTYLAVVRAEAIQRRAALDVDAQIGDVREADRIVRRSEDGLGDVLADLVGVDVERRDDFDIADVVATEFDMHQARHQVFGVGIAVKLQALDQRTGTVAHTGDGQANGATLTGVG